MVLSSCCILPHGAMILDPQKSDLVSVNECSDLHTACLNAVSHITASSNLHIHSNTTGNSQSNRAESDITNDNSRGHVTPNEVIFLFSPHGMSLSSCLSIYANNNISGSAEWLGHWKEFTVTCQGNSKLATDMMNHLNENQTEKSLKCETFTYVTKSMNAPLHWGEVVPLWFVNQQKPLQSFQVIVIAWPLLRADPIQFAPSARITGKVFYDYIKTLEANNEMNIHVIFSCDMSHVHGFDNSLPLHYQGDPSLGKNHTIATQFDNIIVSWAKEIYEEHQLTKASILLDSLIPIIIDAKACGWAGFHCMQGFLESAEIDGKYLDGRVYDYKAPTYYGMMATGGNFICRKI